MTDRTDRTDKVDLSNRAMCEDEIKRDGEDVTEIPQLACKRCGHRWTPRSPHKPRTCPNQQCRSAYWDLAPRRKLSAGQPRKLAVMLERERLRLEGETSKTGRERKKGTEGPGKEAGGVNLQPQEKSQEEHQEEGHTNREHNEPEQPVISEPLRVSVIGPAPKLVRGR